MGGDCGCIDSSTEQMRCGHYPRREPPCRVPWAEVWGDDLLWCDVPVGSKQSHPDFVMLCYRRRAAPTRDQGLASGQHQAGHRSVPGNCLGGHIKAIKSVAQVCRRAIQVVSLLERAFSPGYSVVVTRIARRLFESAGLDWHHIPGGSKLSELKRILIWGNMSG